MSAVGSLSDYASTLEDRELRNVYRYLLNSSGSNSALLATWDRCSFCVYMPNMRLATRNAADHASTTPILSPSFPHPHPTHTRVPAGIWWNSSVDLLEELTWSHSKWRMVNLWMLCEQPTSVTNIVDLAVSSFFFLFDRKTQSKPLRCRVNIHIYPYIIVLWTLVWCNLCSWGLNS